jgi:hypothetical protein
MPITIERRRELLEADMRAGRIVFHPEVTLEEIDVVEAYTVTLKQCCRLASEPPSWQVTLKLEQARIVERVLFKDIEAAKAGVEALKLRAIIDIACRALNIKTGVA